MKIFQISILFLFVASGLSAQFYAPDGTKSYQYSLDNLYEYDEIDTSWTNLHFYRNKSNFNSPILNLGNSGLPNLPFANFKLNFEDINVGPAYNSYFLSGRDIPFFYSKEAYTRFTYTQGMTTEHLPGIVHGRTLNDNFNVSLGYNTISSLGDYERQKVRTTNYFVGSEFLSNNRNFRSTFGVVYNTFKVQENGGLQHPTDFEEGLNTSNRLSYDVFLEESENTINQIEFNLNNSYLFGRNSKLDSVKVDSIVDSKNRFGIYSRSSYLRSGARFSAGPLDIASGYFDQINYDTLLTNDSVGFRRISNEIGFLISNDKLSRSPHTFLGYRYDHFLIAPLSTGYAMLNTRKFFTSSEMGVGFEYGVNGFRSGDISGDLDYVFKKDPRRNAKLYVGYDAKRPEYLLSAYNSNHAIWNNSFNKTSVISGGFVYKIDSLKSRLSIDYKGISNFVYLDTTATPVQNSDLIHYVNLKYTNETRSFKSFRFPTHVNLQMSSSEVLRVPALILRQGISWKINFRRIKGELGVLATYYSKFKGYEYNPALRRFYLQDEREVGNNVFIDAYASLKVGTAKIFVKVDHLNSSFTGYNYFVTPTYVFSDRNVKLGIVWTFWN